MKEIIRNMRSQTLRVSKARNVYAGHWQQSRKILSNAIAFLFILFLSLPSFAQQPDSLFHQANQLYKEKNFEGAAALYDSLVNMGYRSAELYFNLGNAYFKAGYLAPAILNYERAKKLDPTNEDIKFNLDIANLRVADRIEPVPELFFVRWAKDLVIKQSSDGWARLGIIFMWAAFVCGAVFIMVSSTMVKRITFFLGIVALVASLTMGFLAWNQYNYQRKSQQGIIFVTNTYVKSAPDPESPDLFMLREGVKVDLLKTEGDWQRIKLADGKVGWMPKDEVRKI